MIKHKPFVPIDADYNWPGAPARTIGRVIVKRLVGSGGDMVLITAKLEEQDTFTKFSRLTMLIDFDRPVDPRQTAAEGVLYRERCSIDVYNHVGLIRYELIKFVLPTVAKLSGL